ncbi:CBS domain-containing protein [Palleronia sp.]|uniref:CBS domain-containing protein n=1 Tax=Palleronia sp. TaxID=1940284 RepID=UPI0035C840D8
MVRMAGEGELLAERIMRRPCTTIGPQASVRAAAAPMKDRDIGWLPICLDGRPTGVVTDRDLAIRVLPEIGPTAEIAVSEIVSRTLRACSPR